MKTTNVFYGIVLGLLLTSCAQMQSIVSTPVSTTQKVDAPKFTTIDKLLLISPNMTFAEVVTTLGCEPYDLYSLNDKENKTVMIWHYKKTKRNEVPSVMNERQGATTGSEVICCQEVAYLTFDNKKLVSLVTDAGKGTVPNENNSTNENNTVKEQPKTGLLKLF